MTMQQAINWGCGEWIHHDSLKNSNGTCQQFRRNGQTKLWKTRPNEFQIPIKRGLREYYYLTHSNCNEFHMPADCPDCKS
jgi:hypothetical protein